MHQLVQQSNQLTEMAVLDRGECRFRTNYKHLQVDPHDRQTERATSSKDLVPFRLQAIRLRVITPTSSISPTRCAHHPANE